METVKKVRVRSGIDCGRIYTFTQRSADVYDVTGMYSPALEGAGIRIERRTFERTVSRHGDSAIYTLKPEDKWIAFEFRANSYYGYHAVGRTAEEAWNNYAAQLELSCCGF